MASVSGIEKPEIVMEPFISSGETWSIPDAKLRGVWNNIERLGLEEIFFPMMIESAEGFLALCKRYTQGLCFLRRGDDFILIASLTNPGPGHIFARFCPLEIPFSQDLFVATERLVKSWLMAGANGEPWFKVLISVIPETEQRIELDLIGKLGFRTIGKIPGMLQIKGQRGMAGIFSYRDKA